MFSKTLLKILFIILFTLSYFAVRAPNYDLPLVGEDGIFADIFINAPQRPNYGQNARINGKTIYASLGHPSPLYEWLAISGKAFNYVIPLKKSADENTPKLSTYLHFSFSCFQFIAWIFLLTYLITRPENKAKWSDLFLVLFLALSPPAISYSLWLQVDNASGSIIVGLMMSAILLWDRYRSMSYIKIAALLFSAGFISGLGKNEWSILIFLAILATAAFAFYRKKRNIENTKEELTALLWIFLGLFVGNLFSYLFNSIDYMNGFGLMTNMSQESSILNSSQLSKWWELTKIRMSFLYLSLALWLYIASVFIRKSPWKISLPIVLSFFISSAFLWSFFLTSWDANDRYFIPAFIALTYSLLLIRANHNLFFDKFIYIIIVFLGIDILNNYATSITKHQLRIDNYPQYLKTIPTKQGCIHHINYYAFNLKNIDYVGIGNGPGNLEGHLKASGLKVCE